LSSKAITTKSAQPHSDISHRSIICRTKLLSTFPKD